MILNIVVVIEASWLHQRWDPHVGYMIIWLCAYILIYIEDCGCHWGKLPAWALRSAWRKAQLLIWIVLPRAANSTFDNHHGRHHRHDCHQHHHCRHHHYDRIPMIMLARMWCSHIDGSCQSKSKNGNIRKAAIDSWRGPVQDVTSVDLIFDCAHNKYTQ